MTDMELGLDHSRDDPGRVRHRHPLMTMIAYAFLQHRRFAARRRKKRRRPPAATKFAIRPATPSSPASFDRFSNAHTAETKSTSAGRVKQICQISARRVARIMD
jgi:hypothetical protein